MRHLVLTVALGFSAFAVASAQAQSVFVPQDDTPSAQQGSVPLPVTPQQETSPSTVTPAPFSRPNTVGAARSVPPKIGQGAGAASSSMGAVRGMSPEQLAQARQAFEAMAAKNPQMAAINPFARAESLTAARDLQKQISKRVREACKLKFFNVMIPNDLPMNKVAFDNLKGYGSNTVVAAMGGLCADEKMKKSLEQGVGIFNIKHKSGQTEPNIDGGVMMLTLIYDFTLPEPPQLPLVKQKLVKALEITGDATVAAYGSYQDIDQDEMDRRMEKSLGVR